MQIAHVLDLSHDTVASTLRDGSAQLGLAEGRARAAEQAAAAVRAEHARALAAVRAEHDSALGALRRRLEVQAQAAEQARPHVLAEGRGRGKAAALAVGSLAALGSPWGCEVGWGWRRAGCRLRSRAERMRRSWSENGAHWQRRTTRSCRSALRGAALRCAALSSDRRGGMARRLTRLVGRGDGLWR